MQGKKHKPKCDIGDTLCLDVGERPLMANIRKGLIDPDTPQSAMTKMAADGKEWKLVVCDGQFIVAIPVPTDRS